MRPMLNLIEQEELLCKEIAECAAETVLIVEAPGGQIIGYKRERRQAVQRMVAEVYSAPRITKTLKLMPSMELVPGFALHLSGEGENGDSWDFTRLGTRANAKAFLLDENLFLLIGSPPYAAFCSWQALNAARLSWTAQDIRRRRAEERLHERFCCEL